MWSLRQGHVELNAPQRSEPWKLARRRVTASNVEGVLGLSTFKTQESCISEILGGKEKSFTVEEIRRMDLGTAMEDPVRQFHIDTKYGPGTTIIEPSLCVGLQWYDISSSGQKLSDKYSSQLTNNLHPNWLIGGSADGIITLPNGTKRNMEIKYSEKGYKPLFEHHTNRGKTGKLPFRFIEGTTNAYMSELKLLGIDSEFGAVDYFPHIWRSHFYQMQTCMFTNRNRECDYVPVSPNFYYTETVPFDEKYWVHIIYPRLIDIIENQIKPRMTNGQLHEMSTEIDNIIKICSRDEELRIAV